MDRPYENIELGRAGTDGRVGRITLNRPDKLNALSQELLFEFNDALHDYEADSGVRVIVVRGAGHRTYDVGPDGRFIMASEGIGREEEGISRGPATQIHVVENWFEDLKRLVPTN